MDLNENDGSIIVATSQACTFRRQPANFFDFEDDDEIKNQDSRQEIESKINNKEKKQTKCLFDLECEIDKGDKGINELNELIESTVHFIVSFTDSSSCPSKLSPRQAVEKILAGNRYVNLSLFKRKEQKLELLDYAILAADKYTITKVILYLEDTLKSSIFFYELIRRPVAADHYLLYLRSTEQLNEEMNLLNMMGRYEDVAFAMYARAIKSSAESQQQVKLLKRSLQNFTTGGPEVMQWQTYIKEQISLLEQQLPIEMDDVRRTEEAIKFANSEISHIQNVQNNEKNELFVIYPRWRLIGLSLMETLRYCCVYHYHLPDNNFASPFYLKKTFHINERQFLWIALHSLAKTSRWSEIDNLFEYKSWLGSRKIRNIVPIIDVVEVLYQNSSPIEMLEKYLELVDNVERKLQLAKQFHMNKYAADVSCKRYTINSMIILIIFRF